MQLKFSIFFIIISIFINSTNISDKKQYFSENKLLWSSKRTLTWNDFKGIIDEEEINVTASTQCEIKILFISSDLIPNYVIGNYFIKDKSWTKVSDVETLKHEQLHFDIYELFTRKIRKEFKRLNSIKETNHNKYNIQFANFIKEAISMNSKYDEEVYFNSKNQEEWYSKISKELIKYEKYSFENSYCSDTK